jgi:hypothetical protein
MIEQLVAKIKDYWIKLLKQYKPNKNTRYCFEKLETDSSLDS